MININLKSTIFILFLILHLGVISKSFSQCFTTSNGDEMSIQIIMKSSTISEDSVLEMLANCDNNLNIENKLFTPVELLTGETASVYFYNKTKDTTYYYTVEKKTFNWRTTSFEETFGHILLDEEEIVYSFKSGCTFFHVKIYNPNTTEDTNNTIWIKTWSEE